MSKHTPGEWEVLVHHGVFVIVDSGLTIAEVSYQLPEAAGEVQRLANAALIAAAPDLLAACEAMKTYQELIESDANTGLLAAYANCFELAIAAVTKATGGEA